MSAAPLPAPSAPASLLLIKPGSLGDVVHALPCVTAIKKSWPSVRLTWLVDDRWQGLLRGHPEIDELIVFPRQAFRGLGGKLRSIPWAFALRHHQPDLTLDLQGLLRSALMAKLSGAPRIVGLSDAREGAQMFYDETTPVKSGEHAVLRYLRSLQTLGLPPVEEPEFILPCGEPTRQINKPFVLLHPFARGEGKSLTEEQIQIFCEAIQPARVVLLGTGKISGQLPENTLNLLNSTSIEAMIGFIRAATFTVSVDSGPMHIAAAITPRLLSIHTWSDPRLVGPFNEGAWIWQGGEIRPQKLNAPTLPHARSPEIGDIRAMAEFVRGEMV